jgi:starvation-inducible outer membrane lipoprotein
MKYLIILAAVFALGACNSTSSASKDSDESNEQTVATVNDNDGVVCKMEKRIGSNMMTRVCRTAEERAAQAEAGRDGMLRLQRMGSTTSSDGE